MKKVAPPAWSTNGRIFTALFISFVILMTPVMPLASASMYAPGTPKSNNLQPDIKTAATTDMARASVGMIPPPMPAPIITATKADSFPDPNNDGKAEAGDTISYTVVVNNAGGTDATGVTFTDTIDPNTTLVPGSLKVSPLAFADSYNTAQGNPLNVAAPGVLANDTGTPSPTAVPIIAGSTTGGGTVTLNSDGSFTYTPAPAFTGADTFTYTVTNGQAPNDTATVTINVDAAPTVTATSPTNGATGISPNTNITINFSEPVNATTGSFSIECPVGSPQAFALSGSGTSTITLNPTVDLPAGNVCTVTVVANQISDVDTNDPPDNMAANYVFSFSVPPQAVDDMRSATGNVRINTANSGYSVLANDSGPGAVITAFDATTVHGGQVTMNIATGTFTYNPPRGFTGVDSFNYTLTNAAGSDTGTVVLTVTDMIWFINNTAGSCLSSCDGRLTNPFTSLAAFEAINGNGTTNLGVVIDPEAGDHIFIYTGTGDYTGPLTLENNQRVIGQGATSSIETHGGFTVAADSDPLPATGGVKPSITSSTNGVILASDDQLHGLAFNNTTGTAIIGTGNVGTFLMSEIAVSNTTTSGAGISLTGGSLSVTSAGTNTINTRSATALEVSNTTIGVGNFNFRSISAGNNTADPDPASGIILNNTGTDGGLVVTGDGNTSVGGNSSGGTIQNTTGHGISLTNTMSPSFTNMNIQSTAQSGINGTLVNGFTFANGTINNSATANTPASDDSNISFNDSTTNANLTGAASITGSVLTNSRFHGIDIQNTTGTISDLTVSGNTLTSAASVALSNGSAVRLLHFGTVSTVASTTKATLSNNTITNFPSGAGFVIQGGNATDNAGAPAGTLGVFNDATNIIAVTGNLMNGGALGIGNQPDRFVTAAVNGRGQGNFNISNNGTVGNAIRNIDGVALEVSAFGAAMVSTDINNNVIQANNAVGASGIGIGCDSDSLASTTPDNALLDAYVTGNNVSLTDGPGIQAVARNSNCTMNVAIKNNTVAAPNTTTAARAGIRVDSGSAIGNTSVCLDITGNITDGSTVTSSGTKSPGINIRKQGTNAAVNVFGIEGLTPSPATAVQAQTYVSSQNPGSVAGTFGTGGTASLSGANYVSCSVAPNSLVLPYSNQPDTFALDSQNNRTDSLLASMTGGDLASIIESLNAAASSEASNQLSASDVTSAPASFAKVDGESGSFIASLEEQTTALNERVVGDTEMQLAHARSARKLHSTESATANASAIAVSPMPSGETVNATVGTLPAGKSVTITFQVTINNSLPSNTTQVSNQGTVSGSNFASVLTDDPTVGGAADPTVTPVLTAPEITIKDGSVAEPASGSAVAAFTVTLNHAYSQPVTVNFMTASGGANPATAGSDYTTTSGTLTFNVGQTVQTISVPVLADGDNSETDEHFLVNLTGATNGTITDSQALGTITTANNAGTVLISELRTSGPAGPDDDFVELLNNTDSDITVGAGGWALVKMGATCGDTPVIIATIPSGTVIPARGNYLLAGATYSLLAYATADQALTADIEDDRNVALFNTADLSNLGTTTRLDAVGFGTNTGNNCDLLREGSTLLPASGSTSEHSFVRKVDKGATQDSNDNAADFSVVSTTPGTAVGANASPLLGAPGPENSTGPRGPVPCDVPGATPKIERSRLDASQAVGASPNTVRDATPGVNSTFGTIDFRRRFTNNTGGSVSRLRYRIVQLSSTPVSGTADLRALTSAPILVTGVNDAVTCGGSAPCNVTVQGTTLETPPVQALGGAVNSSLAAGTVTLLTPLASGASINLHFLFGVEQEGDYQIGIVIETLTSGSIGQDIWQLRGNTQTGGHSDGGCNTPPVADAGADQTVECAGGLTSVTLDGTASSDPDGDTPLTYEWREGVTVLGTTATLNTSLPFGPHTITLKVTDPSGDFSEDTVSINVVDTTAPLITAPPDVTVYTGPGATECGAVISDATLGDASASDGCSVSVTIMRTGVPSGNNFPVGPTIITYTADDGHGHTNSDTQTVTVIDNTVPTLNVPPDQTVAAAPNTCSANVDPGTATASDNCPNVSVTGTRSDSQPLNAPYPVGVTTITWKATDASNNMTTGTQTITVTDSQAPVITLTSNVISLSPPNHQYVTFSITDLVQSVTDVCDTSVDISDVVISKVTSDEVENATGNGDGNTVNDMVIAPDCKSLQLRRERQGSGDGRVYKITLQVKDAGGNVGTATRLVFVPSSGPVIDSGVNYTVNGCAP